jgi:predicted ABC-type ATPase
MPEARTDSETAKKAQALREAAELGCTGAHRHPDGTWMACSTMQEYERLTNGEKEKSSLDLIEETQKIRSQKGRKRKKKTKRQWDKLRERGVTGIDTLSGGGLVSGKGMTFRPVDGDTDVFDNINQARRRARQLGCIGVSRRTSRSGRRVWTPCTNMTDYARATGSTALGRRYQQRLERQRIRNIVREELSKMKRRKKRLFEEVYEAKGIGRRIGRAARFDPKAWDGDHDMIVQEGTPFERPAIPGINTNLPGRKKRGMRSVWDGKPGTVQRPEPKAKPKPVTDEVRMASLGKEIDKLRIGKLNPLLQELKKAQKEGDHAGVLRIRNLMAPLQQEESRLREELGTAMGKSRSDLSLGASANGGVRSRRQIDHMLQTPQQNIADMEADIDEYFAFLDEHSRIDFQRHSIYRPGDKRIRKIGEPSTDQYSSGEEYGALPEIDQDIIEEHDDLWGKVEWWANFIEQSRIERNDLTTELREKEDALDSATESAHRPYHADTRDFLKAIDGDEDRDTFIERTYGPFETNQRDLEYGGSSEPEWREDQWGRDTFNQYTDYWDDLIRIREETSYIQYEINSIQDQIDKYHGNGTEFARDDYRKALEAKLSKKTSSEVIKGELAEGRIALDPTQGLRSRRDRLSPSEKEWLKMLQDNPGLWAEAPASVRAIASDKMKREALQIRNDFSGGMRSGRFGSGGKAMGQRILAKVKPEHRNKEDRTLYFIGGTTGSGKSTLVKNGSFGVPNDTEAAHIDPDFIKTGLEGWDPKNATAFHGASVTATRGVLDSAANAKMDVVVQGTGKRAEHLHTARSRGYSTVGHFVYVPGNEANKRIAQRTAAGGPDIPTGFGTQIAGELKGHVSRQITQGLYDEFFLWDNTGDTPRLIAFRNRDGHFEINSRTEFDAFFSETGAKYVERYWKDNQ